MKQLSSTSKKIFKNGIPHLIIFLILSIAFTLSQISDNRTYYRKQLLNDISTEQSFSDFENSLFKYEITSDSITSAYLLKAPEKYSIPQLKPLLTDFSYIDYDNNYKRGKSKNIIDNLSDKLVSFDVNKLNLNDRITYELIDKHLTLNRAFCDYPYYESLLGPTTGAASSLPVTLSEFPLNSINDIETYLGILKQIPKYFENVMKYEDKRIATGMPTPFFILNKADDELTRFIKSLKNDNNCFVTTFYERTKSTTNLKQNDRNKYISMNKYYINQYIVPAYIKLQKYISNRAKLSTVNIDNNQNSQNKYLDSSQSVNFKTIPDKNTSYGLSAFNGGKDYYEIVVQNATGSYRTISEMIAITDSVLSNTLSEVLKIATTDTDAYMYYCNHPLETDFHSPEGILEALSLMIRDDYPALTTPYAYKIKTVPDSIKTMVSPAYYMIPPIDDYENNTIYVNPLYTSDENGNLFTTLAHEGFPGHLYQTLYFYSTSPSPIRHIIDYPGYVEGWATYVELNSFSFIKYKKYEKSLPILYRSDSVINLALSSRIDMGVNYEGWTLNDTCKYFEDLGFSSYYASEIYSYVVEAPGNYLSYFIGYLEIEQLKQDYKKLKQDNYSEKEFHKALLDIGPGDFETIRKYLIK